MVTGGWRVRQAVAGAVGVTALVAAGAAVAASSITKHNTGSFSLPAGRTQELSVAYPDALEYGNASYSGRGVVLAPKLGAKGRAPNLQKVRILYSGSVQGGSSFEVRARNGNPAGTAPARIGVTATTVEPLPHS